MYAISSVSIAYNSLIKKLHEIDINMGQSAYYNRVVRRRQHHQKSRQILL